MRGVYIALLAVAALYGMAWLLSGWALVIAIFSVLCIVAASVGAVFWVYHTIATNPWGK